MKLLFVGTNRGRGGTETHFITLVRALHDVGHEVAAVVHPDSFIANGLRGSAVQCFPGSFRNAFDPRGFYAVRRACRRFRPDWIIGSFSKEYWPLALLAKLSGSKLALFKHMDVPLKPLTRRFIPLLADRFIAISEALRQEFIRQGVEPARIQMIYNPLDTDHFHPDPALRRQGRARLGYGDDDIVLGYLGAFHPDKGIFQLIEAADRAMAELPQLKMLWVGGGYDENEFAAFLQRGKYASRHQRLSWMSDVREALASMDLLAFPTVGKETFGRASIEAQACGVPVLCSDRGGIPETLQPGVTGLLLPAGDVPAWHAAIVRLARDAELRAKMRAAGPAWIKQQFGLAKIAAEMTALLQRPD